MTVQNFTAEQVGEEILLSMEVVSGENVWTGAKAVAADADLKVEADILAAEIVEANTVVEVAPEDIIYKLLKRRSDHRSTPYNRLSFID